MTYIQTIAHDPQQPLNTGQPVATRTQYRAIRQPRPQTPAPPTIHAAEQPVQRADILTYRPGQPVSRPGQPVSRQGPRPSTIERRRAMSQPTPEPARPSIVRIK